MREKSKEGAGGEATGGIIKCTFRRFIEIIRPRGWWGVCANTLILQCPRQVCKSGKKREGEREKKKLNRCNEGKKMTEAYLLITIKGGKDNKQTIPSLNHISTSSSENTEAAILLNSFRLCRMHVVAIYRSRKREFLLKPLLLVDFGLTSLTTHNT